MNRGGDDEPGSALQQAINRSTGVMIMEEPLT